MAKQYWRQFAPIWTGC